MFTAADPLVESFFDATIECGREAAAHHDHDAGPTPRKRSGRCEERINKQVGGHTRSCCELGLGCHLAEYAASSCGVWRASGHLAVHV